MTSIDLAYITGFWEGEGTAFCGRYTASNKTRFGDKKWYQYRLTVAIAQKDKSPLLWIQRKLGYGNIYKNFNRKKGTGSYVLTFWSINARKFLRSILPLCKSKYKIWQIKRALKRDKKYVKAR